jgi:hypothetical protein
MKKAFYAKILINRQQEYISSIILLDNDLLAASPQNCSLFQKLKIDLNYSQLYYDDDEVYKTSN